jgi:hypothetical protein
LNGTEFPNSCPRCKGLDINMIDSDDNDSIYVKFWNCKCGYGWQETFVFKEWHD